MENVAYEYRQRILREEERLRNHKTEIQQQQDSRQEQLKQLERSLELRERAVGAREAAAEKKIAEATEAAAQAAVEARQDVEREYMELKSSLAQQRMQIEVCGRQRADAVGRRLGFYCSKGSAFSVSVAIGHVPGSCMRADGPLAHPGAAL